MKQSIKVVNLKCGGCKKSIKDRLTRAGFENVEVSVSESTVYFEGDATKAEKILTKMGYPKAGSAEAESLLKKGLSYISCSIGKLKGKA